MASIPPTSQYTLDISTSLSVFLWFSYSSLLSQTFLMFCLIVIILWSFCYPLRFSYSGSSIWSEALLSLWQGVIGKNTTIRRGKYISRGCFWRDIERRKTKGSKMWKKKEETGKVNEKWNVKGWNGWGWCGDKCKNGERDVNISGREKGIGKGKFFWSPRGPPGYGTLQHYLNSVTLDSNFDVS